MSKKSDNLVKMSSLLQIIVLKIVLLQSSKATLNDLK